ncbi:MAG TPA: META domain-containing protein [Longimicrobiales bacterium]|nr:META domain-containing protein [Longimicrobiales bacterium]
MRGRALAGLTVLVAISFACSQNGNMSAGDAIGTTWALIEVGGAAVDTTQVNRAPTLTLHADGRASGNAGCNQFGGEYELTASTLRFGVLGMTRMACPGRMEVETAYAAALEATTEWRLRNGMLELLGNGRVLARFRRS